MSSESCFVGTARCSNTTKRFFNFKPVADALCSSSRTFVVNCAPKDTLTLDLCEPASRFGYVTSQQDDKVIFKTTCQYVDGQRLMHVKFSDAITNGGWIAKDDLGDGRFQQLDMNRLREQANQHRLVGIVKNGGPTNPGDGVKGERVTLGSLSSDPSTHNALVFMDGDPVRTCPVLGKIHNTPTHTVYSGHCGTIGNAADCSYKRTAIAGGCATKACVLEGITTFREAVAALVEGSELTAIETGFRDRGLARLVDGLKQEGACGTEGVSCLALLGGDCKKLSEAATEMQTQGRGILYRAFQQASEKCIADAGLRVRAADTR